MVRFYADDGTWVQIRWYKVPKDRKPLPVASFVGRPEWTDEGGPFSSNFAGNSPVEQGPQWVTRPYVKDAVGYVWERFTGHYCGTAEQWKGQLLLSRPADQGRPGCCINATVDFSQIGLVLGFTHTQGPLEATDTFGVSLGLTHNQAVTLPGDSFGVSLGFTHSQSVVLPGDSFGVSLGFTHSQSVVLPGDSFGLKVGLTETGTLILPGDSFGIKVGVTETGTLNNAVDSFGVKAGVTESASINVPSGSFGLKVGLTDSTAINHGTVSPGTPNDPVASEWVLVISGYTGGAAALNGTWTIDYVSGFTWSSATVGGAKWQLGYNTTTLTWNLIGSLTGVSSGFKQTSALFHGTSPNPMPYNLGSGDTGHPSSASIVPVP